jgi:hypothetical protein
MSAEFILITEIILNDYLAKIYRFNDTSTHVNSTTIDNLLPILNDMTQSSQIVEQLQSLIGVSKTELFDNNNELVGSSISTE